MDTFTAHLQFTTFYNQFIIYIFIQILQHEWYILILLFSTLKNVYGTFHLNF
jgi:hypothetical protein